MYRVTKDRKYINRAAKEMVMYLDELLRSLPKDNKYRPRILEGYQTMMKSLKSYQTPDGLWNQLIDEPDCWVETSGSAMFTFAFVMGLSMDGWMLKNMRLRQEKHGWL